MLETHCVYSVPVEINGQTWQFSVADCTSTEPTSTIALISNPNTGAEFYLDKTLNYGEVLILVFLLLFAVFGVVKVIADFFLPRRVSKF
jgi:hypothetical protein